CQACDAVAADQCVGGICQCGTGPACAAGLECVSGTCRCTATSCSAGCCDFSSSATGVCSLAGPGDPNACGTGGATCRSCGGGTCSGGVCSGCNPPLCSSGCCAGATCTTEADTACGAPGLACVDCTASTQTNRCDTGPGRCVCGSTGGPCAAGLACVG